MGKGMIQVDESFVARMQVRSHNATLAPSRRDRSTAAPMCRAAYKPSVRAASRLDAAPDSVKAPRNLPLAPKIGSADAAVCTLRAPDLKIGSAGERSKTGSLSPQ